MVAEGVLRGYRASSAVGAIARGVRLEDDLESLRRLCRLQVHLNLGVCALSVFSERKTNAPKRQHAKTRLARIGWELIGDMHINTHVCMQLPHGHGKQITDLNERRLAYLRLENAQPPAIQAIHEGTSALHPDSEPVASKRTSGRRDPKLSGP